MKESKEVSGLQDEFKKRELNFLLIANKADKKDESIARNKFSSIDNIVFISARDHKHLEVLKERMVDKVISGKVQAEDTIVTNARHYHALKEVANL
jgi:tRNA modification GTPase